MKQLKIKLVADSAANIHLPGTMDVTYAPLKIITRDREYVDTDDLDVDSMLKDLMAYKGKSGSSCPGVEDWLNAFAGADVVFCVTITGGLSGSYNSACTAAKEYMEANPGARVFVLDSLSTGPEMQLFLEKYQELILAGKDFDEICEGVKEYSSRTHLIFSLESLHNFVQNGRVNPLVGKAAGLLGIRIVGKASAQGTLETLHKCRGEKRALQQLLTVMQELGFSGGKVRISHTYNPDAADFIADAIRNQYPDSDIIIYENRGLCSYYMERGGVMAAFESSPINRPVTSVSPAAAL